MAHLCEPYSFNKKRNSMYQTLLLISLLDILIVTALIVLILAECVMCEVLLSATRVVTVAVCESAQFRAIRARPSDTRR